MKTDERAAARRILRSTLALHMCCAETDFDRSDTVIVPFRELPGGLRFPVTKPLLRIVSLGCGVVVCCSEDQMEWVSSRFAPKKRDEIFSIGFLADVDSFIEHRHQFLAGPVIKYVCSVDTFRPIMANPPVEIHLYNRDRMAEVYELGGFRYALSYNLDHDRPDMLATVACKDGEVVGMAGASADSDHLWQIGVGVADSYHCRGIGKALVSTLTKAVIEAGKIPYYSTFSANIASNALAQSLGFWHAWTEVYVSDQKRP